MSDMAFSSKWVLVDVSFCKKYFAHAAFTRWQKEHLSDGDELPEDFDPMTEPDFVEFLSASFSFQLFDAIATNVVCIDREKIVYCFDCQRSRGFRRSIFPEYKIRRETVKSKFSFKGIDAWVDEWVASEVEKHHSKSVWVDFLEADDLIAHFVRKIVIIDVEAQQLLLIVSGDSDLLQLTSDRVSQVKPNGEEMTISGVLESDGVSFDPTPANFLKYKILKGDTSDCIPSVKYRKMGKVNAAKLISAGTEAIAAYIKADPEVTEAFVRNRNLIDLSCTPKLLLETVDKVATFI